MSDEQPPRDGGEEVGEEVGSVGEEAAKLFGVLADWARDQGGALGGGVEGLAAHVAAGARDVDEHLATGSAECRWCPVCRTIHAVRQLSPEVRAHLTTAAYSLVQAGAAALATQVPDRAPSGVERIDLDDEGLDDRGFDAEGFDEGLGGFEDRAGERADDEGEGRP